MKRDRNNIVSLLMKNRDMKPETFSVIFTKLNTEM